MNKQLRKGILATFGLLILIFDSQTAINGALSGIEICLRTVVPSLYPFFVLSYILTRSLYGFRLKPLGVLARTLGIPEDAGILLISSLLGGYPVGAKCVGSYYENGIFSREDAEKLLAYCSNSGPAFIFGLVSCLFEEKWMPWVIWLIQMVSMFFVSRLFSYSAELKGKYKVTHFTITEAVSSSAQAMGQVCAWVILFRILISFLEKWILWILPKYIQIMLIGALELTNGCLELSTLENENIRFVICSALLSFGGICIVMQTTAVTANLRLNKYIQGKLLQTLISSSLAAAFIYQRWSVFFILIVLFFLIPRIFQKKVEFSYKLMYNRHIDSGRKLKCSFEKR